MRKLFIPLILCLLLTFTFANFTAPSFEKQPLRISTTTNFFGSDKGLVTIDLNIENLEATTKELFVKIKGLESYKVNMEEIKVDETIFETQKSREEFKQITDSKISWSEKQLRKFKITLAFDPKEIGLAKKFDVQLINDKGELIADLDPFLSGWNYRQEWEMKTSQIGLSSDITNDHVILFKKTSSDTDFWDNVESDGDDIRFTDIDNNSLTFHFEDWNYTNKSMIAWVKISKTFEYDTNMTGYLYYGNSSASAVQNKNGTYPANYKVVWNMQDTSDATGNYLDGTNNGVVFIQGLFGKGGDFERDDTAHIDITPNLKGSMSIWGWLKPESFGSDLSWIINHDYGSFWSDVQYRLFLNQDNQKLMFEIGNTAKLGFGVETDTTFSTGSWNNFVVTFTGDTSSNGIKIYSNSVLEDETTFSGTQPLASGDPAVGWRNRNSNPSTAYDGFIDELKVFDYSLSSDEIKLLFHSEDLNLISFSAQLEDNVAPDLNVVSPTFDLNLNETKTIQFEILDPENDKLDLNIYYSSSSGARTNLIYADTNLQDETGIICNDYNFMVSRTCSYSWDTTTASDGQYYIDVNASDGTATAQASSPQFRVDNTDPTTTFSGCTAGWHNTNQDITLSCDDQSGSGCDATTYRVDGGAWQSYSTPFTLNTDGNFQIDFNSIDYATNQEEIKTSYCAIDKTAPSVQATTFLGFTIFGAFINGVGTILGGVATDILSGIDQATCEYTINGGGDWLTAFWDNNHCQVTNVTIVDGQDYNASTRVDDNAGNTGKGAYTGTYTGDTTAPTTDDNSSTDWTATNQTITLGCDDGSGAGCQNTYYCVDETDTCTPNTIGTSVSVTCASGNVCLQYVRYFSQDNVDNNESVKSSLQTRIDKENPTTTFSGCTAGWHNTNQDITLSCDDQSGSGCDATTYRVDGGAWTNYTIPFSLSTDLNHQIDYNSIDAVANQETIKTSYCAIDKTAPTYTSIDNNGIIFYEPFEIQINGVNFDISGKALAQYRIDSGTWENFAIDYNVPITSDGNYLVDVNLVDNAGNQTLIENLEAFYILPYFTNINLIPDLNIEYFSRYLATATTEGVATDGNVLFEINGINGQGGTCWDYYVDGNCGSETIFKQADWNAITERWEDILRPDDIYPEIYFASSEITWNNAPSNIALYRPSYHIFKFNNQFNVDENQSIYFEFNATPNSETTSGVVQIYVVGVGEDLTYFEEDWREKANTQSVGSFTRTDEFHHSHGANSSHYLLQLQLNPDGTLGSKNLDINGEFYFILYNDTTNINNRWDLKYHASPLCENTNNWFVANRTGESWGTPVYQAGCPDTHIHIARRVNYLDGVNVKANIYSGATLINSDENNFYFIEADILPPNQTSFVLPAETTYYKNTIDLNLMVVKWNEATHPNNFSMTYDINYVNESAESFILVADTSDTNYIWDFTEVPDGNYTLVGTITDEIGQTTNFELGYEFTIAVYIETPPSVETTAPIGSYDKRELIRVEFNVLDANQSTFLVDINYSDTSDFGTGTILIQDENIATSSVVHCIQLGNNFSCYYDANLLEVADGDYYALVNVQGQGADASPQFNIYLGVDPEPAEESYSQRYINPNYLQRDENIYYNPATAYFLTDSEKQNIYLEQNTYLLIGVLIILGIGVFLLWKKRK